MELETPCPHRHPLTRRAELLGHHINADAFKTQQNDQSTIALPDCTCWSLYPPPQFLNGLWLSMKSLDWSRHQYDPARKSVAKQILVDNCETVR